MSITATYTTGWPPAFTFQTVSEGFEGKASVSQAFVAKLGSVGLSLSEDLWRSINARDLQAYKAHKDLLEEVYSLLSKSPYVTEIVPNLEEMTSIPEDGELLFWTSWGFAPTITFSKWLTMRVILPRDKREGLYKLFPRAWNPEQFHLCFNGAVFMVYAPIDNVPLMTEIGQVARELLASTLAQSKLWKIDAIGPTPIHPEVYFLRITPEENVSLEETGMPAAIMAGNDLVVIAPDSVPIDRMASAFLRDSESALEGFYRAQLKRRQLDEELTALSELNQQLSRALATYFGQPAIRRFFGRSSGDIRKLLSDMHLSLQTVARIEIELQSQTSEVLRFVREATFLVGLMPYFKQHIEPDGAVDKNSQLMIMNFAADETSNLGVIQATLIAAFVGAIAGGLITVLVQAFIK